MEKQLLQEMIDEGLSIRRISDKVGKSPSTVRHWLVKHRLKTCPSRKYAVGVWGKKPSAVNCVICGCSDPENFYKSCGGSWCKDCHNKICIERNRQRKRDAVEYKGGKCEVCGYNKCIGSLEFHHIDPSQKDPKWATMKNRPLENIKCELDKCQLVCRNCHGEIHWGEVTNRRDLEVS